MMITVNRQSSKPSKTAYEILRSEILKERSGLSKWSLIYLNAVISRYYDYDDMLAMWLYYQNYKKLYGRPLVLPSQNG